MSCHVRLGRFRGLENVRKHYTSRLARGSPNLVMEKTWKVDSHDFLTFWKVTSSHNGLISFFLSPASETQASIFDIYIFPQRFVLLQNSPPEKARVSVSQTKNQLLFLGNDPKQQLI